MDVDIIGTDGTIYVTAGSPLVETSSDGPYFSGNGNGTEDATFGKWGSTAVTLYGVTTSSGSTTYTGIASLEQPVKGTTKKQNLQLTSLQDYRDFGVVHGGASNVVFADGSVKVFQDLNGDAFLNPGFKTTGSNSGYAANDNTVELPEPEIFSGVLLESYNVSGKGNTD